MTAKKSKLKKTHWIPVAAGFLRQGSKVLVGQRPETHSLAGQWEFPGGKIESGETPPEALARELSEELGIEASVGELKLACTHNFGEVNILILFYEILYWKGQPTTKHHLALQWVEPKELLKLQIPDANRKILPQIFSALGVPWPESR